MLPQSIHSYKTCQGVYHADAVLPRTDVQISLDTFKGFTVNDGLMGALHPEPAIPGHNDHSLGFIAGFWGPTLRHNASVDLIAENSAYGILVPQTEIIFAEVVTVPAPLRLVTGRIDHPKIIKHMGNTLLTVTLKRPVKDLPHHLCRFWVHQEMSLFVGILP